MAKGFTYYQIDTDIYEDRRIKKLKRAHGCEGLCVYSKILAEIFRVEGYFIEFDNDLIFDISEYFDIEESQVEEIVKTCCEVGLFSAQMFELRVLTSRSIQERFYLISAKILRRNMNAKVNQIAPEYCLIEAIAPYETTEEQRESIGQILETTEKTPETTEKTPETTEKNQRYSIIEYNTIGNSNKKEDSVCVARATEAHTHDESDFFIWIKKHAPSVQYFPEPLTPKDEVEIRTRYDPNTQIKPALEQMHNNSAYKTKLSARKTLEVYISNLKANSKQGRELSYAQMCSEVTASNPQTNYDMLPNGKYMKMRNL